MQGRSCRQRVGWGCGLGGGPLHSLAPVPVPVLSPPALSCWALVCCLESLIILYFCFLIFNTLLSLCASGKMVKKVCPCNQLCSNYPFFLLLLVPDCEACHPELFAPRSLSTPRPQPCTLFWCHLQHAQWLSHWLSFQILSPLTVHALGGSPHPAL